MIKKKKEYKKIEKKVINFLKSHSTKTFNHKQITANLNIEDIKKRKIVIRVLTQLVQQNKIIEKRSGYFLHKRNIKEVVKTVLHILPSGKGIIYCKKKHKDYVVPKKYLNKGLHGDKVIITLHNKKDTTIAHVEKIIERTKREYVGILERGKNYGFVLCKKGTMYTDFFIQQEELKKYKDGDKVVVIFKEWYEGKDAPNGKIIKSLGLPGEAETELHAILHEYGLPYNFEKKIIKEAENITKRKKTREKKKRRDFSETLTFTIDPEQAKDYDDAVSFKKIDNDLFEVGIHIADVSHYVRPNTLIDKEAYNRATSVYLVDRVVPMLPEALSNGLCSLRPNEEKYTFSAVFYLDLYGNIKNEWYGKTIINSDYRFSYKEVEFMIENNTNKVSADSSLSGKQFNVSDEAFYAITTLNIQAKQIRKRRLKKGAISFDRSDVNFDLDDNNKPIKVYFKKSKDANKLIEEFMLMANEKVASLLTQLKSTYHFIYRIHDDPDEDKLFNLKQTISPLGYTFNFKGKDSSMEINKLLKKCNGSREQNMIDTLTLRAMSKAEYSINNIGHYGLAFTHYTHFTSPIRRYPDVLVHRLLHSFLEKKKGISKEILEEACKHSSNREQVATKAERDSIKYMQIVFMENKVGQKFKGIISGVTERGIYVEIIENKCEGMIRLVDLKDDYFTYDMQNHSIVGERTKKIYRLGDPIQIKVNKVNPVKRFLDFIPAD